ncbi:381_t:CDS:2, partial [Dentiscutata erythropus]
MSQYSLSPQYYKILNQLKNHIETFNMSLEDVRKNNFTPTTIPDNFIVDEVKLDEMRSAEMSRFLTCKIAETAECPVFSINYRLSPEHQFPAALCSSAGGELAVATALFLRDAGLPLHCHKGLFYGIPKFKPLSSSMSIEFHERVKILAEKIKQKKPKVVSHPSFTKVPRFRLYCANVALAIPHVSPMLAESLGNFPPILCISGGERLADSNGLFSFRASYPNKFQVPKYATVNFANSPFKKPTEVILEVYDELFTVFN